MALFDKSLRFGGHAAMYLVVGFGFFGLLQAIAHSPVWSEKGAAWIQAIGSIAAILSTLYVMKRQAAESLRLVTVSDRMALGRRLQALEALVELAHDMSLTIEKHTEPIADYWDYFFTVVSVSRIEFVLSALKAVPLHTLESYKLVRGVHELIIQLEKLVPLAAAHAEAGDVHYEFEGEQKRRAKYVCKMLGEARDQIRAAIRELGHELVAAETTEELE